jgi:hypothetical protein
MSDVTSNLGLPYIAPSQAQKHVTHNEALRILDGLVQLCAQSAVTTAPPPAVDGQSWLVPAGATGAWAGQAGKVAMRHDGGWLFLTPRTGWRAWVADEAGTRVYQGGSWQAYGISSLQDVPALGIGMTAPGGTPLSAKLNDVLLTGRYAAEGGTGDMVLRANKEAATDDLGLALQVDYATRALVGLFGSNALRLAVSADGTTFKDGMSIDNGSGIVSQPNLPRFKATTNFDNFCAVNAWIRIAINTAQYNAQGCFNATTNCFTAPVEGTYFFGASLVFKQNASTTTRMRGQFILNGTTQIPGSFGELSGTHVSEATLLALHTLTPLAAGDTVELQGYMRAADGYFAANHTSFWGWKVG